VDQDLRIKINKDGGIAAQKNIYTNGFYDQAQRHWLLYTQPDLVEDALNNVIQDISIGAKLDSYNVENINDLDRPVVLSYNFHGPEYLTISGNLRIMPQLAFIDSSLVSKPDRKYPIDLGVLDMRENLSEIELPDGFEVKNMPDSLTKDSPWVIFKVEYRKNKNKITFKQIIESKKTDVTQEEYAQFKSFIEELARAIKQRVVLEKVR
jgi:hypothetical protein